MKWMTILPLVMLTTACNADSTKKDIRGVEVGMSVEEAASAFGGRCVQHLNVIVGLHCVDMDDHETELNVFGFEPQITNVNVSFCTKETFDELKARIEKSYAVSLVLAGQAADTNYSHPISDDHELVLKPQGVCIDGRNGAILSIAPLLTKQHPEEKPRL